MTNISAIVDENEFALSDGSGVLIVFSRAMRIVSGKVCSPVYEIKYDAGQKRIAVMSASGTAAQIERARPAGTALSVSRYSDNFNDCLVLCLSIEDGM